MGAQNHDLLAVIRRMKADHFLGSRRVWTYVRYVEQHMAPFKRIDHFMQLHGLPVTPNVRPQLAVWLIAGNPSPPARNRW